MNPIPTRISVIGSRAWSRFLALSPLTATSLGALFLDEAITTLYLLGLACIVLGLWLARRPAVG